MLGYIVSPHILKQAGTSSELPALQASQVTFSLVNDGSFFRTSRFILDKTQVMLVLIELGPTVISFPRLWGALRYFP